MDEYQCRRCNLMHTLGILTSLAGFAGWFATLLHLKGNGPVAGILIFLFIPACLGAAGMVLWLQEKAKNCRGGHKKTKARPRPESTPMDDRRVLPLLTYEDANIIPPRDSRVSPSDRPEALTAAGTG